MTTFHQQQGFTLVELVAVITLLGILGSTATTRFTNLGEDGEEQVFNYTVSGFRSSANNVQLVATVRSSSTGGYPNTVALSGVTVDIDNTTGWPSASQSAGNCIGIAALPSLKDFQYAAKYILKTVVDLLIAAPIAHAKGGGGGGGANCSLLSLLLNDPNYFDEWTESTVGQVVTYTSPTNQIFTYNASTGEVNITTP